VKLHHLAGAIALTLGAASIASAQGTPQGGPPPGAQGPGMGRGERRGPGGPGGGRRMEEQLFKGITLSQAQQDSLKALRATHEKARKDAFDANRSQKPSDEMRTKQREMMDAHRKQIRDVLTADQQTVFDKNAQEMQERMKQFMERRGQEGPPPPPPGQ
jgi:Spy/CpxP family protein refolding chaperone